MAETSATAGSAIVVLLVGLGGFAAVALWWGRRCRGARPAEGDDAAEQEQRDWEESCREGTAPAGVPMDSLPVLRGAALVGQGDGLRRPPSRVAEGPPPRMHPPLR